MGFAIALMAIKFATQLLKCANHVIAVGLKNLRWQVVGQFEIFDGLFARRWRHPERSRFSGGAKDLPLSRCATGDPSARWGKRGLFDCITTLAGHSE